jgi:hypothetical protein
MANIIKHVGKFGEKPCVVVFRELPEDKDNCLIVQMSGLNGRMHDELMTAVESTEAQSAKTLADVLSRKIFSDGQPMLNALHYGKYLQKVPVSQVWATPLPNQSIPLAELNQAIASIEGGYVPPLNNEAHLKQEEKPVLNENTNETSLVVGQNTDEPSIARNLLTQAELMMSDADSLRNEAARKLEEAYSMDPSLRPVKKTRAKKAQANQ